MTEPEPTDDGERMVPDRHRGHVIYAEHIIRYIAAGEYLAGKVVLDVASGSGYGSKILAERARRVYGVDISMDSVAYARRRYGAGNLFYCCGDAHQLPLPDSSMEAIVSFETIEHLPDPTRFLKEVKRVLHPSGVCIISTPNNKAYASGNDYHFHEFDYDEFESEIRKEFAHVVPAYQSTWVTSALLDEATLVGDGEAGIELRNFSPILPEQSVYFVVVCSDRPITQSLALIGGLGEPWSAKEIHDDARRILDKNALTDQHIDNITAERDELERAVRDHQEWLAGKTEHAADLERQLDEIRSSRSWQAILRYRGLRQRLRSLRPARPR